MENTAATQPAGHRVALRTHFKLAANGRPLGECKGSARVVIGDGYMAECPACGRRVYTLAVY
jgi:hypothetical protein